MSHKPNATVRYFEFFSDTERQQIEDRSKLESPLVTFRNDQVTIAFDRSDAVYTFPIQRMNVPDGVRHCCVVGCMHSAEWMIVDGPSSDDYTDACTDHVGALLQRESTVSPIGAEAG